MGSKRGIFIVIEGVDRSGKSTQCKKLVDSLHSHGVKAKLMNFPDRTTLTGGLISQYLKDKTCTLHDKSIHLLFSANRWENIDKMKQMLNDGCSIIVDRYSYSGIAFSSVKNNMDLQWCLQPEIGLIKPDLVFLLSLSEKELLNRPGFGEERYEDINIQNSVKKVFEKFAKIEDNWDVINAVGNIEDIQKVLLTKVLNKIQDVQYSPLKELNFSDKYMD